MWNYTRDWWFSPPTVANGIVYVGNGDGNVYALDANTGTKIWSYTIGNGEVIIPFFPPPTVANGIVYIDSGTDVYASRCEYRDENMELSYN